MRYGLLVPKQVQTQVELRDVVEDGESESGQQQSEQETQAHAGLVRVPQERSFHFQYFNTF